MKLLLDTHTLVWAVLRPNVLSEPAREAIGDTRSRVLVSVINAWEIAVKNSLGKMPVPSDMEARIRRACALSDFEVLPVRLEHAFEVRNLPWHHKDPFDRLLVAQARVEGASLVTIDRRLRQYDVDILW